MLAEEGYGIEDWATQTPAEYLGVGKGVFEIDLNRFREAVADDLSGHKKSYSTEALSETDWDAKLRERYAQEEADFNQAEALLNVLEGGRGAELFDKIAERKANESERQELFRLVEDAGANRRDIENLIAEAELEAPEIVPSSVPSPRKGPAQQFGFVQEGLEAQTTLPKPDSQREKLTREEYLRQSNAVSKNIGEDAQAQVGRLRESSDAKVKARANELWNQARQGSVKNIKETIATLAKADELNLKGQTIDDYANQGVMFGEQPTAKEVSDLRQLRGQGGFVNIGSAKYVPAKTPLLQEVERITQSKPPRAVGAALRSVPTRLQTALTSEFTPLRKLEQKLYGDKRILGVDMARKFEQVAGAPGKAQADIIEFRKNVIEPIRSHADDFNSYLFLKRVADRLATDPDRKRVGNWTPLKAQAGLAELETKVGPDVMARLEKAGKVYQVEMRKALDLQVESGRMSPDLYQQIVDSADFYAPFKVLKYIEGEGVAGSGRNIGTTQALTKKITGIDSEDFQIGNILQSSAEQIVRSRILAEKNLKMLELDKLADIDTAGELIARVKSDARPRPGYETVRYFKNGELSLLEVQKPVAKAVEGLNEAQAGLISKTLMVARHPFRMGATSANAAFQVVNLAFADLPRATLISRYGVRSPLDIVRYPMDWTYSAYTSFTGNFGKPNPLYMDWLRSGAANSTIQRELTPGVFKPTLGLGRGPRHLAKSVINTIPKFANAIEETSKILGIRRGMRIEGIEKLSGEARQQAMDRIVTEVRNYSGSPDFARRGTETRQLNLLFMFLNARIQGTSADLARLAGRTGAKDAAVTWGRLGIAIGIPTTMLALVNLSPDYKEDYDKVPEWEREHYWMIPRESHFINEDTGERVRDYWRIPKREISQIMANTIESGIRFAHEGDPKEAGKWSVQMLESLSPVNITGKTVMERGESVIGSTNPVIKLPVETFTGRDTFRHREIVPEYMKKADPKEQYRASTPRGYVEAGKRLGVSPLTVEHVTQGATGGGLGQFAIRQAPPGRSPLTQYPILKRFVRSGALAEDAGMGERVQQAERDETTRQVIRRREAVKLLASWRGLSDSEVTNKLSAIREKDPKLAEKIGEMRKEQGRGLTSVDRQIAQLGIESGDREKFIRNELSRMKTQAERDVFIEDLKKKGLLPRLKKKGSPPQRPQPTF